MTIIQLGKAYPLKARELETRKDKHGNVYKFVASVFVMPDRNTVMVMGKDEYDAWCSLKIKAKNAPSWLRRGIRDAERVPAS